MLRTNGVRQFCVQQVCTNSRHQMVCTNAASMFFLSWPGSTNGEQTQTDHGKPTANQVTKGKRRTTYLGQETQATGKMSREIVAITGSHNGPRSRQVVCDNSAYNQLVAIPRAKGLQSLCVQRVSWISTYQCVVAIPCTNGFVAIMCTNCLWQFCVQMVCSNSAYKGF